MLSLASFLTLMECSGTDGVASKSIGSVTETKNTFISQIDGTSMEQELFREVVALEVEEVDVEEGGMVGPSTCGSSCYSCYRTATTAHDISNGQIVSEACSS